jgi:two-component system sensor histidine kinase VicK
MTQGKLKSQKRKVASGKKPPTLHKMSMEEALAALIQRNEELISLNKSKDEFIAITSHQLRTPATAVKQYIGLLLQGYAEPLTNNQRVFLEKAYESNERQLHIVDAILRIAQLDLDKIKLRLTTVDINNFIDDVATSLSSKFQQRQQKIKIVKCATPTKVKVDIEQMRMAIENILENASNYSPDHKKISVRIAKKGNRAWIQIKDEGVGINKKDFSKLFQKFSRINNPLTNFVNGTGLGLYFSKKIVELHGGNIKVRSSLEKGTTFIITLSITEN